MSVIFPLILTNIFLSILFNTINVIQSLQNNSTYSDRCLLVRDNSALYDLEIVKTSPMAGRHVSKYNCDDCVKYACEIMKSKINNTKEITILCNYTVCNVDIPFLLVK